MPFFPIVASCAEVLSNRSLQHRQRRPALLADFFPAAAEFSDGVGGLDVDLLIFESCLTTLHLGGEDADFLEQPIEDLVFGDGGDLLALDVDDAAVLACEDGDVAPLRLARAIHDASH